MIVIGPKESGQIECYGKLFRCNVCEWGQQVGYDTFDIFKAHHHQRHQQLQWAEVRVAPCLLNSDRKLTAGGLLAWPLISDSRIAVL